MDKKEYVTWDLDIRLMANTDIVRTSLTAVDKFNDGWELEVGDFVQKAN